MSNTRLFTEEERAQIGQLRRRIARCEYQLADANVVGSHHLPKLIESTQRELTQLHAMIGQRALKMQCDGLLREVTA